MATNGKPLVKSYLQTSLTTARLDWHWLICLKQAFKLRCCNSAICKRTPKENAFISFSNYLVGEPGSAKKYENLFWLSRVRLQLHKRHSKRGYTTFTCSVVLGQFLTLSKLLELQYCFTENLKCNLNKSFTKARSFFLIPL